MGFVLTPINKNRICPHCGHVHGENYVEHTHDNGVTHTHKDGDVPHTHEENNMIKKIWKVICWPWKKVVDWLWTK